MSKTFKFANLAIASRHHLAKRLSKQGFVFTSTFENANFSDKHLSLDESIMQKLEYKDHLATLLKNTIPSVHPLTYNLNEENRDAILATIFLKHYLVNGEYLPKRDGVQWIVKPALINNGNAIFVFDDFEKLRLFFMSSERLGGPYVIQRYIDNPMLIDGRKYTYRMTVVATNYAGVYLYKDGYINQSGYTYDKHSTNKEVHLTNYFLEGTIPKVTQTFSQELKNFSSVYTQMVKIVQVVFSALLQQHPMLFTKPKHRAFELLGFDFVLENTGKLWLLEINQGPDFPVEEDHPLAKQLWDPFWQGVIDGFVLPIALSKPAKRENFDHIALPGTFVNLLKKVIS